MEVSVYMGIYIAGFIALLNIVLTIIAFHTRWSWIMFPVLLLWIVAALSLNPFVTEESMLDIYYVLRILCITMSVASGIMLWGITAMGRKTPVEQSEYSDYYSEIAGHQQELDQLRNITGGRRRRTAAKARLNSQVADIDSFYNSRVKSK